MQQKWAGIARLGGVGDNLIAASVLPSLKTQGYSIDVIADDPHHVVFENNPYIDKLSVKVSARDLPQGDMLAWQNWFEARGREYELFVNLSHTCEGLLALFPAQTAFYWPVEARRKLCGRSYIETVCDIVGVPHIPAPLFYPTDEERQKAAETKMFVSHNGELPVIGWCLCGTRIDKIYPATPIAIARLIKELNVAVVMIGAPLPAKDFEMAKQVQEFVQLQNGSDKNLHLALSPDASKPTWPLRRGLSFANACDLVIGPDTGPMWSVAFEKLPKIMLHSHASVENICHAWINTVSLHADQERVPCSPCHRLHDSPATCIANKDGNGAACISDIKVDQILDTARVLLKDQHHDSRKANIHAADR